MSDYESLCEVTNWWNAIIHNRYKRENGVWELTDGREAAWLHGAKIMLERPCYLTLKDMLLRGENHVRLALVTGKTGVGVSMFLRWLIAAIYEEARDQPEGKIPVIIYQPQAARAGSQVFQLGAAGVTVAVNNHDIDYYFSDDSGIDSPVARKLTLLATTNSESYRNLKYMTINLDDLRDRGCNAVLPAMDWEELKHWQQVCPHHHIFPSPLGIASDLEEEYQFRYDVLSGHPRMFRTNPSGGLMPYPDIQQLVENQVRWYFGPEYCAGNDIDDDALTSKQKLGKWAVKLVADELMAFATKRGTADFFRANAVDPNLLKGYTRQMYASSFLGFVAEAIGKDPKMNVCGYGNLAAVFTFGWNLDWNGSEVFEFEAHRALLASSSPFHADRLLPDGKQAIGALVINITKKRKVFIRNSDDIARLKSSEYGMVITNNHIVRKFPLSAIIKPDICLVMTTNDDLCDAQSALEVLTDVAVKLNKKMKDIKLVFVVPLWNSSKYYQTSNSDLPCQQYVMTHEQSVHHTAKKQKRS